MAGEVNPDPTGVIQRTPNVEALAEEMPGSALTPWRSGVLWNSGQV